MHGHARSDQLAARPLAALQVSETAPAGPGEIPVQRLRSSCFFYIFAAVLVSLTATRGTTSDFATPVSCLSVHLSAGASCSPNSFDCSFCIRDS